MNDSVELAMKVLENANSSEDAKELARALIRNSVKQEPQYPALNYPPGVRSPQIPANVDPLKFLNPRTPRGHEWTCNSEKVY